MEYVLNTLNTNMEFKNFILNENKAYFGQRVGDILNALQDLNDSAENMGARHLVSNAETIVNQMRRIIHTHWSQSEESNLIILQKCGVAIMKAIEEKDDLIPVLKACQQHVEEIIGEKETSINDLEVEKED